MSKLYSLQKSCKSYDTFSFYDAIFDFCTWFFWHLDTILYKPRWDTCSTKHQKIRKKVVCVQNDMFDSIFMFPSCVLPLPPPASNVGIHMTRIHSRCTILDNIDFGERGGEVLLQNVPTVLYKIVSKRWKKIKYQNQKMP